jgi:ribosome maturation factor RimP
MKTKPIAEIVAFLQPIAEEVGVEIVDAEWNLRARALTVYIDAAGGVDLNLCEKFHRAIDERRIRSHVRRGVHAQLFFAGA